MLSLIPLIVIVGPTAVGKTEFAIQLAERIDGEIVSADSRLFYRGVDIGTAKPTQAERCRIPHHLIDVTSPDQAWSLALFQRMANQAILDIHQRGKLPFLVGGTGQYIRAVIEEWEIPKSAPNPAMRGALERWADEVTPAGLHQRLAVLDQAAASRIDLRNLRRTIRALEVILVTGRRFSEQRKISFSRYHLLHIGLTRPRPELYSRIDQRIQHMIQSGLEEETRNLLAQGYSPDLPALSAIGYHEMIAYIQGKMTLDEAVTEMKRATRIFVRRQANWFKANDPTIRWFTVGAETLGVIEDMIRIWLNKS